MDENKEGLLLIGTSMILLVVFLLGIIIVMLIYRRRKIEHRSELIEISERVQQELIKTQLETKEQTMKDIGMEIHDNVNQQLTLAFLYVGQLESSFSQTSSSHLLSDIKKIIDQTLDDLRGISSSLMQEGPGTSLIDLLRTESSKIKSLNHCEYSLNCQVDTAETSTEVNSFVLRIFQEFIQNSLKHSKCSMISTSLQRMDGNLVLNVSDDGSGFNIASSFEKGLGLNNMKKRAEIIGGHLRLESEPGNGTRMILTIPETKSKDD